MVKERECFYDKIPIELLSCFCYYIQKKILKENLEVPELKREICYINKVGKSKGMSLLELYHKGLLMSKYETQITNKEFPPTFLGTKK